MSRHIQWVKGGHTNISIINPKNTYCALTCLEMHPSLSYLIVVAVIPFHHVSVGEMINHYTSVCRDKWATLGIVFQTQDYMTVMHFNNLSTLL